MQLGFAGETHEAKVLGIVFRVHLRKRKLLRDAAGAAKSGTKLALCNVLDLDLALGLSADAASLLRHVLKSFNFQPVCFETIHVHFRKRKNWLLRVKWKTHIILADSDHCATAVEGMRLVDRRHLFRTLLELLLEGTLVLDHFQNALVYVYPSTDRQS